MTSINLPSVVVMTKTALAVYVPRQRWLTIYLVAD